MFKDLQRHTRLAEFKLLYAALLLVGTSFAAVGLFSDRIEQSMQNRTSAILGADGLIRSTRPLNPEYEKLALEFGLEVAHSVNFLSMAITESASLLAGVRAVSSNYPLRGEVILSAGGSTDETVSVSSAPAPGTIWAATPLVQDLNLDKTSELQLGESLLRFNNEIVLEPEGGAGMLRLAPRLLMNIDDLEKTGLITPASRARFRLLVAGPDELLAAFADAIEPRLNPYESWYLADLRRDEVRNTIGRINSYIRLAVLLTIVLAIVAMALAAQGLWGRQIHEIALLRCLGQKHKQTIISLITVYILAAVPVLVTGTGFGYGLQYLAGEVLRSASGFELPAPTWHPVWHTLLIGIAILSGIMIPILVSVKHVSTMTLLRTEHNDSVRRSRAAISSILILIVAVVMFLARDPLLGLGVLLGFFLAAAILWVVVRTIISTAAKMITPIAASWYTAIKAVRSNSGRSAWLTCTFGATMFALVLLGGVRTDLYAAWQKSVPADAPNLFLINIKQHETDELSSLLQSMGVPDVELFAVIRGRIAAINDSEISEQNFDDKETRHRINHDFNLTELTELPVDNNVVAGNWFNAQDRGYSVERETAEILGIAVGDRLTMDVAGMRFEAPVTNLREVKWDNMRPNFFIIATPGLLDTAPRNYITGIFVKNQRSELTHRINKSYPNITAIDLGMLLTRFRNLSRQGSDAVSVVFVFTLIAAILVLVGVLQGQRSARQREIALLKILGAGRKFIRKSIILEFAFLGALAGLIGGMLALLSGWYLAHNVFEFSYSIPWQWLLPSIAGATIVVVTTGYLSVRSLLDVVPVKLLARADGSNNQAE
jgi:putative ABC transport system permease protein